MRGTGDRWGMRDGRAGGPGGYQRGVLLKRGFQTAR
jgi:hypothetical protein